MGDLYEYLDGKRSMEYIKSGKGLPPLDTKQNIHHEFQSIHNKLLQMDNKIDIILKKMK